MRLPRRAAGNVRRRPGTGPRDGPDGAPSFAGPTPPSQIPRCVFQLMKQHYSRLHPGGRLADHRHPRRTSSSRSPRSSATTGTADKSGSIVYAVGAHPPHLRACRSSGASGIVQTPARQRRHPRRRRQRRARPRQHPGQHRQRHLLGDPPRLPGHPADRMETMADYLATIPAKQLRPNSINYFGTNYKKFLVSLMKAFFGPAATSTTTSAYSWIPKPEKNSSWLTVHDEARAGRPRRHHLRRVHRRDRRPRLEAHGGVDGQPQVAGDHGPAAAPSSSSSGAAGVDPRASRPRALFLPSPTGSRSRVRSSTRDAGPSGSTRCCRPPARSGTTTGSSATSTCGCGSCTSRRAAPSPTPCSTLHWPYTDPLNPRPRGAGHGSQRRRPHDGPAAVDVRRPRATTAPPRRGTGSTADPGPRPATRWTAAASTTLLASATSTTGPGRGRSTGGSSTTGRRPTPTASPGIPTRPGISWNGSTWVGDVPDFPATSAPAAGQGAFIMTGEGVARLFAPLQPHHRRTVPRALRADRVAHRQPAVGRPGATPPPSCTRTLRPASPRTTPTSPTSPRPTGSPSTSTT